MQKTDSHSQRFDWSTISRFLRIAKPFFFSDKWLVALGMLLTLMGLSWSVTKLSVQMSDLTAHYITALTERNTQEFYRYLILFIAVVVITTPVAVMYSWVEAKTALIWRRWLTQHFLKKYFAGRVYYRINIEKKIDNPDQRLADEIRSFTGTSLSFVMILFNSVLHLVVWTQILWGISSQLTIASVMYAFVGSLVTLFIGRRLVALNFIQLRREADFRYGLIHVRDNSEAIAFYGSEEKEAGLVGHRLRDALRNLNYLIGWERNLGFFTKGYDYMRAIVPIIIVAPLYLAGDIKFGLVTQATIAFTWVVDALSLFVQQFPRLSAFAASIARLGSLWDELEAGERFCAWPREAPTMISIAEDRKLVLDHLTLMTPNRARVLIRDLSLTVNPDESLLITGSSGIGKTSLFRAIAGLWTEGDGRILMPPLERVMFLPQRPYMVLGSLRNQLRYAVPQSDIPESQLAIALREVGLAKLLDTVGGWDAELDWSNVLPLGEQQRIAFARVLLSKPEIAFLDEATTALDMESEERMYKLLRKRCRIYVSIGHRPGLRQLHSAHLELLGDGTWQLSRL